LFQTKNDLTLCVSAPGHGGMEAGFCNLIEDGDVVLIAVNGLWGERAADMAKRLGAKVRTITKAPGEQFSYQEVKEAFMRHSPTIFFIAHGESSTGMLQNLDGFGDLCRESQCLFYVDAVITLGCVPFYVDRWKIDVAYTGSQKVLNAPPGITPMTFSPRAM
jgi:alanine-glyoxylate transaminase / serine-glyoxylate transaminase / serine-pyruvate transaminase